MNILLTNDDGIEAPGLWAAAQALSSLGHVLVVAPSANHSGYGAALPPVCKLLYSPYRGARALPGVTAFSLAGTPATCVQVGLSGALSKRPIDLVVSGINDGLNVGRDIFYSGTVGAALTAYLMGAPALAASLDGGPYGVLHWETAAWAIQETILSRSGRSGPGPFFLNLNIPNRALHELAGVITTTPGSALCLTNYEIHADSEHALTVAKRETPPEPQTEPGTDAWAISRGYVSITPLRLFFDSLFVAPNLAPWEEGIEVMPASLPQRLATA